MNVSLRRTPSSARHPPCRPSWPQNYINMESQRKRQCRAEMYRLLALYESGGSSRPSCCAEHGLAPHTLDDWHRKYLLYHPRQSAEPAGGFRQLLPPAAPGFGYFVRVRPRDGHYSRKTGNLRTGTKSEPGMGFVGGLLSTNYPLLFL